MKLMLIKTQVKVVVEVGFELGNLFKLAPNLFVTVRTFLGVFGTFPIYHLLSDSVTSKHAGYISTKPTFLQKLFCVSLKPHIFVSVFNKYSAMVHGIHRGSSQSVAYQLCRANVNRQACKLTGPRVRSG